MKITLAKSDLEVALKVVSATVGSGTDLSSHYLFRVKDGAAEVMSYDMRVFSRSPLTAEVDGEDGDAFTVEAWRLDKWVSSVKNGVLTLSSDEKGEVIAKGTRSRNKLRSLDPSRFPFWDGLLSTAEDIGDVSPAVLHDALGLSRHFVSADDTNRPELCQIEGVEGVIKATNRRAVSAVTVRSLMDLDLCIPGKDLGVVLKFLSDKTTQEDKVSVKTATRSEGGGAAVIFCRPDGSYVGVSRPSAAMPRLPIEVEDSGVSLTLDVGEFAGAVDVLLASAPKGHDAVEFSTGEDGSLVLSMPSDAGGHDTYPLIRSTAEGLDDLTFALEFDYVRTLSDHFSLDHITFTVHQRKRGGYVSFTHDGDEEDSNFHHAVLLWRM